MALPQVSVAPSGEVLLGVLVMLVMAACCSQILCRFRCPEGVVCPCCVDILTATLTEMQPSTFLQIIKASYSMSSGQVSVSKRRKLQWQMGKLPNQAAQRPELAVLQ